MKKFLPALVLAVMALPVRANAQTTETATASVIISDILSISVNDNTIDFGTLSAAGASTTQTNTLTVSANSAWTLSMRANATNFTPVGTGVLPASRLEWQGAASWDPITTTDTGIGSGAATSSTAVTMYYRINLLATDPKDTYSLGITYSLVGS